MRLEPPPRHHQILRLLPESAEAIVCRVTAYVGQTRSRKLVAELAALGIGECFRRKESRWPPRRTPWFYDNGAFGDWKSGQPFDVRAFESDLAVIRAGSVGRPDFIVCPDKVAGGRDSLAFSMEWLPRLRSLCPGQRVYLVVQDGMVEDDLPLGLGSYVQGIFVGGTRDWKLETGPRWVRVAHKNALPCHIGRVGTGERVRWARLIGADSLDSSLPLWGADNLRIFVDSLFGPGPLRQYRKGHDEQEAFLRTPRQGRLAL